jgi:peptidoglycan glycosyltransferase
MINNTVANNGVLMQPMLVSKIVEHNGTPVETYGPQQLSTVASANAAYQVRQAMYAVTSCGSGWLVNREFNFANSVAGKTGTGQINNTTHPQGWMLTQAPFYLHSVDQMPDLTIVAMRERGGEGAYAAGPAIMQMYQDIFSNGYVKTKSPMPAPVNPNTYCPPNKLWLP